MVSSLRTIMLAALTSLAAHASAQSAFELKSGGATIDLPFGGVPTEIFGIPCKNDPGDAHFAASLRCFPANSMEKPSINVSVANWRSEPSQAEMIANMREAFHERSLFKVIREETFAPPSDPMAVGFRGLYQTELGNRYVWAVRSKGKMVRVIAAVFAPIDANAMMTDIEQKIFGVPVP